VFNVKKNSFLFLESKEMQAFLTVAKNCGIRTTVKFGEYDDNKTSWNILRMHLVLIGKC